MGPLTIVNPGAEIAVAAPWVNVSNVLSRRSDVKRSGSWGFATTNVGAYDCYQDIAVPAPDQAAVDAGTVAVDFIGYAQLWSGAASTMTMYVKALNGGGTTLQTWNTSVVNRAAGGTNYQQVVVFAALPTLTRTIRVGWSGSCLATFDVWVDDLTLALSNVALQATKAVTYSAVGIPPGIEAATKAVSYAVAGPQQTLTCTKAVTYGVLQPGPVAPSTQRLRVSLVCRARATA